MPYLPSSFSSNLRCTLQVLLPAHAHPLHTASGSPEKPHPWKLAVQSPIHPCQCLLAFIFCSACNFSLGMFDGSVRKFHWLCPMRYFCCGVWPAVGAKAKSNSGCTFRTQHGLAPAAPRAPLICPSEVTAPLTPQLEYGNSR